MKQFLQDHDVRSFAGRHQALIGFIVSLVLIFGTVAYVARESARTTHALCALRHDLEIRVSSGESFLKDHPNGIPGIPAKQIRDGIENQKRTIKALSALSC